MKYNTGGRGNTPIINDRNMGKIGTMSQSNLVTTHGIFNTNIMPKVCLLVISHGKSAQLVQEIVKSEILIQM